jgi:hypothetical protein
LLAVVREDKSGGSIASEGSSESEENNVLGFPLVLRGDELSEIFLGDVGLSLMEDVEQQLFSSQEFVNSKSSGFDGNAHNQKIIIY